ncbi:MAG: low temperature requirement protein A [Leptolyngbyaceae cyanobacterium SM2_5_2]|nr:low temperature requirement protein A [Leptolyngbyaceae cyanobacterium SM2_5_2]
MGLLVDILTPMFTLRLQRQLPRFSASKLPERFGLFVIIVLGESVVGTVQGLAAQETVTLFTALTGILGLALAFGIWWIYFDFINRRSPKPQTVWAFAWGYLHLPLVISIAATGAGILNVIVDPDRRLSGNVSLLIGLSVGMSLIVMGCLELTLAAAADEPTHPRLSPGLKLGAGLVACLLGSLGNGVNVITLQLMLMALLLVQMGYALYVWFTQELAVDEEL